MNGKNFSPDTHSAEGNTPLGGAGNNLGSIAEKNPQLASLLSKLSDSDKQKLQQVLNDPEQTRRILATPQAQNLLRSLQTQKNGEKNQ